MTSHLVVWFWLMDKKENSVINHFSGDSYHKNNHCLKPESFRWQKKLQGNMGQLPESSLHVQNVICCCSVWSIKPLSVAIVTVEDRKEKAVMDNHLQWLGEVKVKMSRLKVPSLPLFHSMNIFIKLKNTYLSIWKITYTFLGCAHRQLWWLFCLSAQIFNSAMNQN